MEKSMRYVPRKRLTVEIEVELRKGITQRNLIASIKAMPLLQNIRAQAQVVKEIVVDHKND